MTSVLKRKDFIMRRTVIRNNIYETIINLGEKDSLTIRSVLNFLMALCQCPLAFVIYEKTPSGYKQRYNFIRDQFYNDRVRCVEQRIEECFEDYLFDILPEQASGTNISPYKLLPMRVLWPTEKSGSDRNSEFREISRKNIISKTGDNAEDSEKEIRSIDQYIATAISSIIEERWIGHDYAIGERLRRSVWQSIDNLPRQSSVASRISVQRLARSDTTLESEREALKEKIERELSSVYEKISSSVNAVSLFDKKYDWNKSQSSENIELSIP